MLEKLLLRGINSGLRLSRSEGLRLYRTPLTCSISRVCVTSSSVSWLFD